MKRTASGHNVGIIASKGVGIRLPGDLIDIIDELSASPGARVSLQLIAKEPIPEGQFSTTCQFRNDDDLRFPVICQRVSSSGNSHMVEVALNDAASENEGKLPGLRAILKNIAKYSGGRKSSGTAARKKTSSGQVALETIEGTKKKIKLAPYAGFSDLIGIAASLEAPPCLLRDDPEDGPCLMIELFEFLSAKDNVSAVVRIKPKEGAPKTVVLSGGDIVSITEEGGGSALLDYLISQKMLTKEQIAQIPNNDEASVQRDIYDAGLLTLREIALAASDSLKERFFSLLSLNVPCKASFVQARARTANPIKIPLTRNLVQFVKDQLSTMYRRDLEPLLFDKLLLYPKLREDEKILVFEMILTSERERKTARQAMHGKTTTKVGLQISPVSEHDFLRLIIVLSRYGALEWLSPDDKSEELAILGEGHLRASLTKYLRDDPFARIGAHWGSHPWDVERAYARRQRQFGPNSTAAKGSSENARLCEQIMETMTEAYNILMEKKNRIEIRAELIEPDKMVRVADILEKQATLYQFRGEYPEAFRYMECAIEMTNNRRWIEKLKLWKSRK